MLQLQSVLKTEFTGSLIIYLSVMIVRNREFTFSSVCCWAAAD
jgi:hypothetical protein